MFLSPHVEDVRERVTVDGRWISKEAFLHWADHLLALPESGGASFFELLTVIGLAHFAASGVDAAVVEAGLGGRLDSTNVLSPVLGIITNISMDHEEYLGQSLEEIALEKAGIAKPGCPLVIGERDSHLQEVIVARARSVGADPVPVPEDCAYRGPLRLAGMHQRQNASVAACACRLLPQPIRPGEEAIRAGFARAFLPGRLETLGRWVLDGAHNTAGARALRQVIDECGVPRPRVLVFGALPDKDRETMLRELRPIFDRVILTNPPGSPPDRATARVSRNGYRRREDEHYLPDPAEVLRVVNGIPGTVVVTGSFYTVAYFRARLPGFRSPR